MCGCAGCCCWGSTMELSTDKFMMLCVEDVMLCIELRSCACSRLQHGVWSTCVQGERWSLTEHWPGPGRGQGPVSHGGAGTQPGTGGRGSVSPRSDTTLFSGAAAPSSEQLPGLRAAAGRCRTRDRRRDPPPGPRCRTQADTRPHSALGPLGCRGHFCILPHLV